MTIMIVELKKTYLLVEDDNVDTGVEEDLPSNLR